MLNLNSKYNHIHLKEIYTQVDLNFFQKIKLHIFRFTQIFLFFNNKIF